MAEPDFDIDQFKNDWQKQNVQPKYDSSEIEQMLNRKSRNYVKYIFWISFLEFAVILFMNVYYYFVNDSTDSIARILEKLGVTSNLEIQRQYDGIYFVMKMVSFFVTGLFVILFYINFRKIKVESNLKRFILQIIKFKKTVNAFILVNIGLIISFVLVFGVFFFRITQSQSATLESNVISGLVTGVFVAAIIGVGLLGLYYRLVYGIILRRLGYSLKQLEQIEAANEE